MIAVSSDDALLGAAAVAALQDELQAYPKPGLVSPIDSGSHSDMDFALMSRSADSLLESLAQLAAAGRQAASFEEMLMPLGIDAERRMLAVTGGINTHRGAIFSLGLCVAAIARATAAAPELSPEIVQATLRERWGDALAAHAARAGESSSHGARVLRETGRAGARREASLAFPSVFQSGIPAYRQARQAGLDANAVHIHTLFALMASVDDTTVLFRGGLDASLFVRDAAATFLADGGCLQQDWFEKAERLHRTFVERKVSAGGCADLLACTLLVARSCAA